MDAIRKIKKRQEEIGAMIDRTIIMTNQRSKLLDRAIRINECVICHDSSKFDQAHVSVPCGHGVFCSECVDTMRGTSTLVRCPLCNRLPIIFMKLYI
jgi:hypothetical protein